MMISDADFEELFFDDVDVEPAAGNADGADGARRQDPLQDAATLAMMTPFGAAVAMMSVFGAQPRT